MAMTGAPFGPPHDIPDFTAGRVLPPYVGTATTSASMSPYATTLTRIAEKLCGSPERQEIMRDFLKYRRVLAGLGMIEGFQWLSGSFMEDIETLESRCPNDIDIVTFFHRPVHLAGDPLAWMQFQRTHWSHFDKLNVKPAFHCDVQFVDLDSRPTSVVSLTRFWFGLFSHRREGLWKGMLQVPLAVTADDASASAALGGGAG